MTAWCARSRGCPSPVPFLEGENLVSLVAQEGEADVSALDYIRLTYWHTCTAEQDSLHFTSASARNEIVTGFTTPDIRVADITNPRRVHELTEVSWNLEGLGYTVRFGVTGSGKRTLLAFTEAAIKFTRKYHTQSTFHVA